MKWKDPFKEKPKIGINLLLKTESGQIVTGWLSKMRDDDIYYCLGNEYSAWDYEFNYDLGAVVGWLYLSEILEGIEND